MNILRRGMKLQIIIDSAKNVIRILHSSMSYNEFGLCIRDREAVLDLYICMYMYMKLKYIYK